MRLVRGGDERAEAIFIAKEIGRLVGGVGMLEAQETGAGRGSRSFGEIAVLCRTRRQLERLEFCMGARRDSLRRGGPGGLPGRRDRAGGGKLLPVPSGADRRAQRPAGGVVCPPRSLARPWSRLINMAVFFSDMPDFLENLTLGREADLLRRGRGGVRRGRGHPLHPPCR